MPKRSSKSKLDTVQNARRVVLESVGGTGPSPAMVSEVMRAMGARGGRIGGKRRLVTMTAERRKEIARLGARTRWGKKTAKAKK